MAQFMTAFGMMVNFRKANVTTLMERSMKESGLMENLTGKE
jgi:hypothetical protein